MVIPPRFPQFNWVDLGLPSGTLWLDRLVGAPSPSDPGLYYQWGAVKGHTATDGFVFNSETYAQQGLYSISADLTEKQDAARAFYGPNAKMPSKEQLQEFIQYTSIQSVENNVYKLISLINGHSILLYGGGYINNNELKSLGLLRAWCSGYFDQSQAYSIHGQESVTELSSNNYRNTGLNVLAVHS